MALAINVNHPNQYAQHSFFTLPFFFSYMGAWNATTAWPSSTSATTW